MTARLDTIGSEEDYYNPCSKLGYIVFRNALSESQVQMGLDAIDTVNDTVNYTKIKQYIDSAMVPFINAHSGWDAQYVKFRISNNNNSSDAALFHRDVICYDPNKQTYPIFTFLSYLDTTVMELWPGSHNDHTMGTFEAARRRYQREQVTLHPGDLLLFSATLLHRGIFTNTKSKNRRLLQVFDVYPNESLFRRYSPTVLQVKIERPLKVMNFMIQISKVKLGIELLDYLSSLNAATGYGYNSNPLKRIGMTEQGFTYTSVTHKSLAKIEPGWQPNNLYVTLKPVTFAPEDKIVTLQYVQYTQGILYYLLFIVLILVVVIYLVL